MPKTELYTCCTCHEEFIPHDRMFFNLLTVFEPGDGQDGYYCSLQCLMLEVIRLGDPFFDD